MSYVTVFYWPQTVSCTRFTACEHIILLGIYLVVKMVHVQLPLGTLNSPAVYTEGTFYL